ncbi:MAG: hypothetical protein ACRCSN_12600, partial [Dermatophilaceae bacterium]
MSARTGVDTETVTGAAVPTGDGAASVERAAAERAGAVAGEKAEVPIAGEKAEVPIAGEKAEVPVTGEGAAGGQASRASSDLSDAGDGSVLGEVSIASASATETRHHPPRAANGRFVRAPGATSDDEELPSDRFLDREISWLQFNERVLQLAADDSVPLLERARYL